jgi:glycerophosphoryl diester phosphodiesterase
MSGTVVTLAPRRNRFLMTISGETLKIVGHRGWPSRFPDNVLAGIEAAAAVADMVEVDVRLTRDEVLILSHDPALAGVPVTTSGWPELAGIDLGGGHHPLSLDTLLAAVPDLPLNLEVKNSPDEPGFDSQSRSGFLTADRARPGDLITSFHWPTVDALRASHPAVATGLLVDRDWSLEDAVDHALQLQHLAVAVHWELARSQAAVVTAAAGAGLAVLVWTLNDSAVASELEEIGVTAVVTDDPGAMRSALREET